AVLILLLCICALLSSCKTPNLTTVTSATAATLQKELSVQYVPSDVFQKSLMNAKHYPKTKNTISGVVPHHLVAADLIAGFFESIPRDYETVIILAPDHSGGTGQVIASGLDWSLAGGEISCDREMLADILKIKGISFVKDDDRLQNDHSASNLIPYVKQYIPNAKIVPLLLTNRTGPDALLGFARSLYELAAGKKCLFLFSLDFSHYLLPTEAEKRDKITRSAIEGLDYGAISRMNSEYLDCPPGLIVFLRITELAKGKPEILDNSSATEILKREDKTTTYFILRSTR
ncbi:MAG: AmmeMemoRadiSam system protein B, partial [Clostridiales bacterium 43-6]